MDGQKNRISKVLIVDDDSMIRETLHAFLINEHYDFSFASSGIEAIHKIESDPPDVILLDIMMPGLDGFEVCRQIKNNTSTLHIPIILVTALDSAEDITRGLDSGADEFISKPVDRRELNARVRSMLRIKHQYDNLENAMRLREDLTNLVVHDMRSPLNILMGHGEMLVNEPGLSNETIFHIKKIIEQSARLNKFIDEMLIVARMEQGEVILNLTSNNLGQIINRIVTEHNVIAKARNLKLTIDAASPEYKWSFDEHLISRVIDNLLSNALKFSPPNSEITIQTSLIQKDRLPFLLFRILDQGPGISGEFQTEIFDKFKVVELKKAGITQIGLGLFFCKMVIEAHGGSIWVNDNIPLGSIFNFEIPAN